MKKTITLTKKEQAAIENAIVDQLHEIRKRLDSREPIGDIEAQVLREQDKVLSPLLTKFEQL